MRPAAGLGFCLAVVAVAAAVAVVAVTAQQQQGPERYAREQDEEGDVGDPLRRGDEDTLGASQDLPSDRPEGGGGRREGGRRRGGGGKGKKAKTRQDREDLRAKRRQQRRQQKSTYEPENPVEEDGGDEEDDYYAQTWPLDPGAVRPGAREPEGVPGGADDLEDDDDYYDYGGWEGDNGTQVLYANCTGCWNLDELRFQRIEQIKRQILRKLRLRKPPKTKGVVDVALANPAMTDWISNTDHAARPPAAAPAGGGGHGDDDADFYSTTEKILIFGEKPPRELGLDRMGASMVSLDDCIYFRFDEAEMRHYKITWAEFSLYIRERHNPWGKKTVMRISTIRTLPNGNIAKKVIENQEVALERNGTGRWFRFSFKHEVSQLLEAAAAAGGGGHPLVLEIQARDSEGNPLAVLHPDTEHDRQFKPYLEVRLEEVSKIRSKRMLSMNRNCKNQNEVSLCCRYDFRVDFDQIGWDWIIRPRTYEAFMCAGDCPFSYNPGFPHSHVMKVSQGSAPAPAVAPRQRQLGDPCCTPVKMSKLTMIYLDHTGNFRYGMLTGMVVDRCGCA